MSASDALCVAGAVVPRLALGEAGPRLTPRGITPRDLSEGPSSYRIMETDEVRTDHRVHILRVTSCKDCGAMHPDLTAWVTSLLNPGRFTS